jgi:CRISPR-associated endonuclease/helicase Cas3
MLDSSDVVGSVLTDSSDDVGVANRRTLCWRGPEDSRLVNRPFEVKPGDTVVIPADLQGWDSLGFIPETRRDKSQVDVGDAANYRTRSVPVLRLFPDLVRAWSDSESCAVLAKSLEALTEVPEDLSVIKELLKKIGSEEDAPGWLRKVLESLLRDKRMEVRLHPFGGLNLKSKKPVPLALFSGETFTSEDDSALSTVRVVLKDHISNVSAYARAFAQGSGLAADIVTDLILAAEHHDLGKADPRFQVLLRGGDKYAFGPSSPLLAKSGLMPEGYANSRIARQKSRYPDGNRHEMLSVRFTEASPAFCLSRDPELVLYLIGAHHGRGRPFAPISEDSDNFRIRLEIEGRLVEISNITGLDQLDSGIPDRFWNMVKRYGWWGIAFLESILRLADHRCSEQEQKSLG